MNDKDQREASSCGDNCRDTRRQAGKIMAVFGLVIAGLAWYIISEGILQKVFS